MDCVEADMKKTSKKYIKPHKLYVVGYGDLIVDVDWESSGLWVCEGNRAVCVSYAAYQLPGWLIERFRYWTGWYSMNDPRHAQATLDGDLFTVYGRSLAVDVKRMVSKEQRVFYGFRPDKGRRCVVSGEEIILPDEELVRRAIPMGSD